MTTLEYPVKLNDIATSIAQHLTKETGITFDTCYYYDNIHGIIPENIVALGQIRTLIDSSAILAIHTHTPPGAGRQIQPETDIIDLKDPTSIEQLTKLIKTKLHESDKRTLQRIKQIICEHAIHGDTIEYSIEPNSHGRNDRININILYGDISPAPNVRILESYTLTVEPTGGQLQKYPFIEIERAGLLQKDSHYKINKYHLYYDISPERVISWFKMLPPNYFKIKKLK